MLKQIINDYEVGVVIGEAGNGAEALPTILSIQPDYVIMDLLMPELDGIETIERLKTEGYPGQFIMISQVVNKDMVGEAYRKGVEFFIHKPINRIEVSSILKKTTEQFRLKDSLLQIQGFLGGLGTNLKEEKEIRTIVMSILNDMGIVGESGSDEIVWMIEYLINETTPHQQLPALKVLYEKVARKTVGQDGDIQKESKAIEQRIRRMILAATNNLASLGLIDYTNPEFEYYAPRYFDFQDIRSCMKQLEENTPPPIKVKINSKKFLQMLYRETLEKYEKWR